MDDFYLGEAISNVNWSRMGACLPWRRRTEWVGESEDSQRHQPIDIIAAQEMTPYSPSSHLI